MGTVGKTIPQTTRLDFALRIRQALANVHDISARVAADFVMVHTAMLAAIAIEAFASHDLSDRSFKMASTVLRDYYVTVFCPVSVLFPGLYALGGLYTAARSYRLRAKLRIAAATAAIGALLLFLATWSLNAEAPVLAASLIFCVAVIAGTPGIRWLKAVVSGTETGPRNPGARGLVLVVGGAGYIGSIVVRKLLNRGYFVRVLDSLVYGDQAIREVLSHPRLDFYKGDCRDIQDVVGAMVGVSSVVHLAAIVGDPACDRDKRTAREINYAATRMISEIAKGEGVARFVFASSCSVYGVSSEIVDETSEVNPISLYAETKVDSERALLAAATARFHPTILRLSTIFGLSPRPRFDLVVNLLTAKAKEEGIITIYNGQQWRPFLHVCDAAEAIVRVLEAPVSVVDGQVFNVGDDRLNYTLEAIGRKIQEVFPDTRIERIDNSDHRDYRVSFNKIRDHLKFRCSRTLDDGIRELAEAFASGVVSDYKDPLYSNLKFLQTHGSPLPTNRTAAQVMAALAEKA